MRLGERIQPESISRESDASYVHVTAGQDLLPAWSRLVRFEHPLSITHGGTEEQYERNQAQLARNAYRRAGGVKSGRSCGALLAGLPCCARCGRRLRVAYTGRTPRLVYRCDCPNLPLGKKRCITFGGFRAERLIADAVLDVLAPHAIEAAKEARAMVKQAMEDRKSVLGMELQQARYNASLAERRCAARDPDNRLIASELERRWEYTPSSDA